jgi:hypothetical protein
MADDMRQLATQAREARPKLPENDYVSPGLVSIMPDAAFPNLMIGDTSAITWPYLRSWVEHNWYTDRLHPHAGFINRDEAAILYNAGLLFAGKDCLEIGCWRGWSAVHLALAAGRLDVVDPILAEPEFFNAVTQSLHSAGVHGNVRLFAAPSPAAVDQLAQQEQKQWSLIFIDGDHEGDAPKRDAQAVMRRAAPDAMVLFHDLASPFVAAGLHELRNAGWHTMVYQTMQIMGVAWRGNVEPVVHVPDPNICWTLPAHLAGYTVSNWRRRAAPSSAGWAGMSEAGRYQAAMRRAQAAEDAAEALRNAQAATQAAWQDAAAQLSAAEQSRIALETERDTLKAGYQDAVAQVHAAALRLEAEATAHQTALGQLSAYLDVALTERAEAAARADSANGLLAARQTAWEEERRQAEAVLLKAETNWHETAAQLHRAEAAYAVAKAQLEDRLTHLANEAATAQATLAVQTEQSSSLAAQLQETLADRDAAQAETAAAHTALAAQIDALTAALAQAKRDAQDQLATWQAEHEASQTASDEAQAAQNQLISRLQAQLTEAAAAGAQLAAARAQVATLQAEAVQWRTESTAQANTISALRNHLRAADTEQAQSQAAATRANRTITAQTGEIAALHQHLAGFEATHTAQQQRLAASEADCAALTATLADITTSQTLRRQRHAALAQAHALERQDWQRQLDQTKARLAAQDSALAQAQARIEASESTRDMVCLHANNNQVTTQAAWAQSIAVLTFAEWASRKRVLAGLWRRGPAAASWAIERHASQTGAAPHLPSGFTLWLSRRTTLLHLLRRTHDQVRDELLQRLCPPEPVTLSLPAWPTNTDITITPTGPLQALQRHLHACHPTPIMPDRLLHFYVTNLGFSADAANAWLRALHGTNTALPGEHPAGLSDAIEQIRQAADFDAGFYVTTQRLAVEVDPALHYALVGEPLGLPPSARFDPLYYKARNPDIAAAGLIGLLHYHQHGRFEGRSPLPPATGRAGGMAADSNRQNLLLVVHETSRTGAPILGWNIARLLAERYNLFIVSLGDGPLTPEFAALAVEIHGPFMGRHGDATDIAYSLQPLFTDRQFAYAIVNSIESRRMMEICAYNLVPSLLLMHEFGSTVFPATALQAAFDHATELVFSAPVIAKSSLQVCPSLARRTLHIAPQGMSLIPASNTPGKPPADAVLARLRTIRAEGGIIVLGAGSVGIRKGVDLFLATASQVQAQNTGAKIQFVWVGHGYHPNTDMGYSIFLQEQIQRSSLDDGILFLDEVSDLDPLYALTDLFYLSSRLDPLPNVTIDAAHRGIPIICFAEASGMADILRDDPVTTPSVVGYLNTGAAADIILHLAHNPEERHLVSDAILALARRVFDMAAYVASLDRLGQSLAAPGAQWRADAALLQASDHFDQAAFLGEDWLVMPRQQAVAKYIADSAAARRDASAGARLTLRPAWPGFDATAWEEAHPETPEADANPLADWVRLGARPRLAA